MFIARHNPLQSTASATMLTKAATVFLGLSNQVRLSVLLRILEREWSVNELALDVGVSQSALSQHLVKLRRAGIVSRRRDGATAYYHCANKEVIEVLRSMALVV